MNGGERGPARPYVPAPEPGPKADGLTGNWAEAMADAEAMRKAVLAAEQAAADTPHRRRVFPWAVLRMAALVAILAGTLAVRAGMAVKTWAT